MDKKIKQLDDAFKNDYAASSELFDIKKENLTRTQYKGVQIRLELGEKTFFSMVLC